MNDVFVHLVEGHTVLNRVAFHLVLPIEKAQKLLISNKTRSEG